MAKSAKEAGASDADLVRIAAGMDKLQQDIDALNLSMKSVKSQSGSSAAEVADVLAANHADKLRGPRGDQGERGLQGLVGERGPMGLTGLQGSTGAEGPTAKTDIDIDAIVAAVLGSSQLRAAPNSRQKTMNITVSA